MTQGARILDRAVPLGREPMQSQGTRQAKTSGQHLPRRRVEGAGRRGRESFPARATLAAGAETNGRQPATRDDRRAGVTPRTGIARTSKRRTVRRQVSTTFWNPKGTRQ